MGRKFVIVLLIRINLASICTKTMFLTAIFFLSILIRSSYLVRIYVHVFSYCWCSVAQSCPTLCDPMDCSMPGFYILHYLPKLAQTHVHAIEWHRWCHSTISSSVTYSSCLQSKRPSIRVFSSGLALHIRWPKYWSFSFSISPSNEYSRLISFRIDWFDLHAVQGTLKSSPTPQSKSISSSSLSLLYGPILTSTHDYWN